MDDVKAHRIVRKIQFIVNDIEEMRVYDPEELLAEIKDWIESGDDTAEYDEMEAFMNK